MSEIKKRFELITPIITNENRCCVYKITFECGMFYIGSTLNLSRRATQYRYNFYNRNDINKKLKAALNTHNTASISILEICVNEKTLRDREDFYIKENFDDIHILNRSNSSYSNRSKKTVEERYISGNYMRGRKLTEQQIKHWSDVKKGCIITQEHRDKISKSKTGLKFTDEHKKNISLSKVGKPMSEENKNIRKGKTNIPVNQFDKNGIFIKSHLSYSDAAKEIGVLAGHIGEVVNGKYKHKKGFIFKKKIDE